MKMMLKAALLMLCLSSLSFSQKKLGFDFDYAQFAYDSTRNYVELYYAFNQADLKTARTDSGSLSQARLGITIKDSSNGKILYERTFGVRNRQAIGDSSQKSKSLVGVVNFLLNKGTYEISVKGADGLDTSSFRAYKEKIRVQPIVLTDLGISDIELATNIITEDTNKKSIFYKNTLEVVPNPTMLFSEQSPVLFYYSELYGKPNRAKGTFILQKSLVNSRNKAVYTSSKRIPAPENSIVEANTILLKKFPTDTYRLVLSLADSATGRGVSSVKRFFFFNPSVKDTTTRKTNDANYIASEFGVLSDEECDDQFDRAKYEASKREIEQYQKLTELSAKRKFLYGFWNSRNTDPSADINPAKAEYMGRVKYADEHFSSMYKKGYKSDRGRVYVIYGEPDQIDRYPSGQDKKPYETWTYNSIEGGVIFVFADLSGFSEYELIHSTKNGEVRDDNWETRITTTN